MQEKPFNHSTTQPLNKFGLPNLGFGLGLRSDHYEYIFEHKPKIDWFEVISENYMDTNGQPRERLRKIREHYPVILHGVSLSIGSPDPLNMDYLRRLKALANDIKPEWISDHLCWTGMNGKNTHDLLPVPLTEEALAHVIPRIRQVQDFLERPILIENPSTYLSFRADNIPEYEFMARMAEAADCGILLDVNNIYVSCFNHRLDAKKYIDAIPAERVVQIHLAGHYHSGNHIVDTHDDHVTDDVWKLYSYTISRLGFRNTMIEWDGNIPEFPVLEAELEKARQMSKVECQMPEISTINQQSTINNQQLHELQENLQTSIMSGNSEGADTWILPKENFPPAEQLGVYIEAYRLRIRDVLLDDYEVTFKFLGDKKTKELIRNYIDEVPSEFYNISHYCEKFGDWLAGQDVPKFALELADLERTVSICYDQPDSAPLNAADLAAYTPEQFAALNISPRTASFFRHYKHDVNSYYTNFYHSKKPKANLDPKDVYVMIYRKEDKVYRQEITKVEFELLQEMHSGKSLEDAMAGTIEKTAISEEKLAAKIQEWFSYWLARNMLRKVA